MSVLAATTIANRAMSPVTASARFSARKIATPPSIAVGARCQRSAFGCATEPMSRANPRTAGVRISDPANAVRIGTSVGDACMRRSDGALRQLVARASAVMIDDAPQHVIQRSLRLESDQLADL